MNKKCIGCGALLQDNNTLINGYTTNLSNDYCMRCFRLTHYGEYKNVTISKKEFTKILDRINQSKSLVLYVVDVLSIPNNFDILKDYLYNNDIILVINKIDVLPYSVKASKIKEYFVKQKLFFKDIIVISSLKDYQLDLLMSYISNYKKEDNNVYVIGNTNAGKSTLINRIIKNYTVDKDESITMSPLPSTTLNEINIKLKDFTIIDTPGFVDDGNIVNYLDFKTIKAISTNKEIKPITYVLKENNSILINDFIRIDYLDKDPSSFTFYMSNDLKITRINGKKHQEMTNYNKKELNVKFHQDLVINGLGFIKITNACKITIYLKDDVLVFLRNAII